MTQLAVQVASDRVPADPIVAAAVPGIVEPVEQKIEADDLQRGNEVAFAAGAFVGGRHRRCAGKLAQAVVGLREARSVARMLEVARWRNVQAVEPSLNEPSRVPALSPRSAA